MRGQMLMWTAAAVMVGISVAPVARGQANQDRGKQSAAVKGAINDRLFVAAAAEGGMAEVAASKLAIERAASEEVKRFARQMVDDHTRANQELMRLAGARQIGVPQLLSFQHQAESDILAGLSGEEFDRCYMKQQFAAHICTVGLFEAEAERGQDQDLKAFAAKQLPTLREHLDMARRLAEPYLAKRPGTDRPGAETPKDD
ncbi:MAG: DUF4142 domain-containing protein [Isosphaeraceae bacterium]|nr:DUF4142 domain-containing protein [Isosphaeraceae bacterium]